MFLKLPCASPRLVQPFLDKPDVSWEHSFQILDFTASPRTPWAILSFSALGSLFNLELGFSFLSNWHLKNNESVFWTPNYPSANSQFQGKISQHEKLKRSLPWRATWTGALPDVRGSAGLSGQTIHQYSVCQEFQSRVLKTKIGNIYCGFLKFLKKIIILDRK